MKVFLSWSGERSKLAAEELGNWTARVIQAVEPWISSGIEKGARWQSEIADRLEDAKVGIVCLSANNLSAPWILFEAGALSKTKGSYVCTFLLDVASADIEMPLAQFQHTVFAKEEVLKLMQTINRVVESNGERALTEENLGKVFETFWPQLETELRKIKEKKDAEVVRRPDRQLLEEVVEILRAQEQRAQAKTTPSGITVGASLGGQPGKLSFTPVWQEKDSIGRAEEFRVLLKTLFDQNMKTEGKPGAKLEQLAKKLISEKEKETVEKPEEQPKSKP